MGCFIYTTDDGEQVEHFVNWANRPDSITLSDGRVAHYDFGETARHIHTQSPKFDSSHEGGVEVDVHPSQSKEYNQTAAAIGLDTRWDANGRAIIPNRSEAKKLKAAMTNAKARKDDVEYTPPKATETKRIKT